MSQTRSDVMILLNSSLHRPWLKSLEKRPSTWVLFSSSVTKALITEEEKNMKANLSTLL